MRKFKASILVAAMTLAALAQTAAELDSPEVNRVAIKLNCDCGCNLNMACKMPPDGRCPVCQRNKAKILSMQRAGMKDQQILDQYVTENGKAILVMEPGIGGILGPVLAGAVIRSYGHTVAMIVLTTIVASAIAGYVAIARPLRTKSSMAAATPSGS